MPNESGPVSGWLESMRIGVAAFDDERRRMLGIVELLDVDPEHGVRGEFFLDRLGILSVVLEKLYRHEELLMDELRLPDTLRALHRADHDRVMSLFVQVYEDSMNNVDRKALEVYETLRRNVLQHIADFGMQLKSTIPPAG